MKHRIRINSMIVGVSIIALLALGLFEVFPRNLTFVSHQTASSSKHALVHHRKFQHAGGPSIAHAAQDDPTCDDDPSVCGYNDYPESISEDVDYADTENPGDANQDPSYNCVDDESTPEEETTAEGLGKCLATTGLADRRTIPATANLSVGRLHVLLPSGQGIDCTAFKYAANVIATSAHCVTDYAGSAIAKTAVWFPGQSYTAQPYSCATSNITVPDQWTHGELTQRSGYPNGNIIYDYAKLTLAGCTVGNPISLLAFPNGNRFTGSGGTYGYPCDKLPGTQISEEGSVTYVDNEIIRTNHYSASGQSGSPFIAGGRVQGIFSRITANETSITRISCQVNSWFAGQGNQKCLTTPGTI